MWAMKAFQFKAQQVPRGPGGCKSERHLPLERDGEYELRLTVAALAGQRPRRASIEDTIMRKVMIKKVNSERSEEAMSINDNGLVVGEGEQ